MSYHLFPEKEKAEIYLRGNKNILTNYVNEQFKKNMKMKILDIIHIKVFYLFNFVLISIIQKL